MFANFDNFDNFANFANFANGHGIGVVAGDTRVERRDPSPFL